MSLTTCSHTLLGHGPEGSDPPGVALGDPGVATSSAAPLTATKVHRQAIAVLVAPTRGAHQVQSAKIPNLGEWFSLSSAPEGSILARTIEGSKPVVPTQRFGFSKARR